MNLLESDIPVQGVLKKEGTNLEVKVAELQKFFLHWKPGLHTVYCVKYTGIPHSN